MREIPLELRSGPFTLARAAELGVSRRMLDGARFRTPFPGVRVLAGAPDTLPERCRAAALVLPPQAAFSHDTAVWLGGWPRPLRAGDSPIHVSVPTSLPRPRITGLRGHRVTWRPADVSTVNGLRVTAPGRTWCDLAASGWSILDLVMFADALRRRCESTGLAQLHEHLESWEGQRSVRRLHRALALSSDRVDSPMETRMRLLFRVAGLPTPQVNEWVEDSFGHKIHRPDLSWPQWKVAADYDGAHHLEWDAEADVIAGRRSNWRRRQDLTRQDQLAAEGWQLRVFTAFDLFTLHPRAVARMRETLKRAGCPIRSTP